MMVCDSVVLANGCLDHLLDDWSRKTAAWGRTVDGEAPPGHTVPPHDPDVCLNSCKRMCVRGHEQVCMHFKLCLDRNDQIIFILTSAINIRDMFNCSHYCLISYFPTGKLSGCVCFFLFKGT